MMKLGVIDHIDSSHFLPGHATCGCIHGHTYKVELTVLGEKKDTGMVIDFYDLKATLKKVLKEYDHRCLNDLMEYPSVENLCESMYGKLKAELPFPLTIKVWEGQGKWCETGDF